MVATRRSAIAVIDEAAAAEAPAAASAGEAPAASTSAEDTQKTLETQEQLPTHSENTQNVEPATEGMNVAQEVDAVVPPTPQPGNVEPATEGMAEADAVTQEKEITAVIPPTPVPGNLEPATEGMSASASMEAVNGNDPASVASQQPETVANVEPATEGMALSEVPAAVPPTPQPGNTDPATEGMAVEGQTASAEVTAVEPPTPAPGNVEPATEGMQIDSTTAQENGDAAPATNGDASHAAAGDVSMVSEGQTMDPADATAAAPEANGTTPAVKQEQRDVSASQEPPRTKIYIGGLPPRTERADLEDCFGQFGEIDHLELKTGYAFIEYRKPESAAEAIETYNEGHFLGAQLKVESSKSTGTQRENIENNTCFICGESGHYARTCPSDPRHASGPPGSEHGGRDERSQSRDDRRNYRRPPRSEDPARVRLPADFNDPHTRESARHGPRDPFEQRERDRIDAARDRDREMRRMMDSGRMPPGPPPFMGPPGYGPPPGMMGGPYGGPPGYIPGGGPPPMMRGPGGMHSAPLPPRGYDYDDGPRRFYDGPSRGEYRGPPGRDDYGPPPGRFDDRDRDRDRRRFDRDRSPPPRRERDRDYMDDPYYRGGPPPPGMGYPPRGYPGDDRGPPMGPPPFSAPPYGSSPPMGYDRRRSPPPPGYPPRGGFDYPGPPMMGDRGFYPPGPPGGFDDRRGPPGYGPDRGGRDPSRDERYTPYPSPGGRSGGLPPRSSLPPPPIPPPGSSR